MVSEVKSNTKRLSDALFWEVDKGEHRWCREEVTLANASGAAFSIPDPMGYPVVDNGDGTITLVEGVLGANNEAACNALLISEDTAFTLADGATSGKLTILNRGPALIKEQIIDDRTVDHLGNALVAATLKTGLLAEDIDVVAKPPKTETQTT